jgi:hypothetical protein
MFQCANDECESNRWRNGRILRPIAPGEKPVLMVTKERTVGYAENGVLYATGKEVVEELPFCRTCNEIALGMNVEADVVGHKVIDRRVHKKTGKLLRIDVLTNVEELENE